MKTSRMMFYSDYVTDEQLVSAVKNSSLLDTCYVGLYEKTWTGKPHQRINLNLFNQLPDFCPNVKTVQFGDEELQIKKDEIIGPDYMDSRCRNYITDLARKDGHEVMIIQDTDEFLLEEDYHLIINQHFPAMRKLDFYSCAIKWKNFWKNWNTVLVPNFDSPMCYEDGEWANFGFFLDSPINFSQSRDFIQIYNNKKSWIDMDVYLHHGSYVLNDEEVLLKVQSWTHSQDIDMMKWYAEKWLKWEPEMECLHPSLNPCHWKRAIPYNGKLPRECK